LTKLKNFGLKRRYDPVAPTLINSNASKKMTYLSYLANRRENEEK
jgi:hypothetical protein